MRRLITVIVIVVLVFALGPRRQTHEGFFAPIYSPDRASVLFVHRQTTGWVWGLGYETVSPAAYVYIGQDNVSLRQLDRATKRVTTVKKWPSSPLEGELIREYRSRIFGHLMATMQGSDEQPLQYMISLPEPRAHNWTRGKLAVSALWDEESGRLVRKGSWYSPKAPLYGGDEPVTDGRWELMTVKGREAFPSALVEYDKSASRYRVLQKSEEFARTQLKSSKYSL